MPSGSGGYDGDEGQGREVPILEEPESIDFLLPQIPDEGLFSTLYLVFGYFRPSADQSYRAANTFSAHDYSIWAYRNPLSPRYWAGSKY